MREEWKRLEDAPRASAIAAAIVDWAVDVSCSQVFTAAAFEWPQIYREKMAKGVRPADLLKILAVACSAVGMLAAVCPELKVIARTPRELWDQVPKSTEGDPWLSMRGVRVKSRLNPSELVSCEASHDAIDAVGIGLIVLGRFDRVRVFAGAT